MTGMFACNMLHFFKFQLVYLWEVYDQPLPGNNMRYYSTPRKNSKELEVLFVCPT